VNEKGAKITEVTERTPAHLRDTVNLPPYFQATRLELTLRRKLLWMASLRIVMMMILVMATTFFTADVTLAYVRGLRSILMWVGLMSLIPAALYYPAIYSVRSKRGMLVIAMLQVVQDCLFAAVMVAITGGTGSAFTFFFSLSIIVASVLIGRRGAIIAAILSFGLLGIIGVWEIGVLGHPAFMDDLLIHGGVASVLYAVGINVVGFVGIGFLAQYLSEQLRRSDIQRERFRVNLEDLRQLHESILSSVTGGIITCRLDHRILHVNRAAEVLLAISARVAKGRVLFEMFPEAESHMEEPADSFDVLRNGPGGEERHLAIKITPLLSRIGDMVGRILFVEDVTNIREMENKMQADERLATIGKLAAVVAHEIRNPLASISASAQMLRMAEGLEDDDKKALEIVVSETDNLSSWISDLLEYSSPRRGEETTIELNALLAQVLDVIKADPAAKRVEVNLDVPTDLVFRGDSQQLHRVFLNLAKNAVEAMAGGGRLRVAAWTETGDNDSRWIRITVSDNGMGIQQDEMEKVFDAFHTTKARGTGLGLATVARVIEEYGGRINVESHLNVGTVFTVMLPHRTESGEFPKVTRNE